MKLKKIMSVAIGVLTSVTLTNGLFAVNGAGASFPAPCYQKWMAEYANVTKQKVNYQSVGSGAGLAQIRAKTVNFGASDEPLKSEVLEKDGMIQFPMLMGGIVIIVNLPGVKAGELKLSRDVLADIFLGKIKNWSDGRIASINEGISLPDEEITVVHRADGSGTTWNFTNYLSKNGMMVLAVVRKSLGQLVLVDKPTPELLRWLRKQNILWVMLNQHMRLKIN